MTKLSLILLAVGCGGASKPAPQQPGPEPVAQKLPAPTCEAVGDKLSTVIDTPDEKPPASIALLVTERCKADAWNAEARECLGTAENVADTEGCTGILTEPQRTSFANLTGGAAADSDVFGKVSEFTERMCACQAGDADCAKRTNQELMAWMTKQKVDLRVDPRIEAVTKRLAECMVVAMTPVKQERRSRGGAVKQPPSKTSDPCAGGE